ncbi:hypothetical protein FACS189446_0020 [Bacteroidia bacterium]|nr:hypothetical protein FACS189446_0020 [Bacteroidia bacterium]
MYEDAVYGFRTNRPLSVSEEWEYAHGRYETRKCSLLNAKEVLLKEHLHWHLDVTFGEDNCRARKGYAAENLATLRKLALQIIHDQHDKLSLKKRRLKAAYDMKYLKQLLCT